MVREHQCCSEKASKENATTIPNQKKKKKQPDHPQWPERACQRPEGGLKPKKGRKAGQKVKGKEKNATQK